MHHHTRPSGWRGRGATLLLLAGLLLGCAGCAPLDDARRMAGLSPTLPRHIDHPQPASPARYLALTTMLAAAQVDLDDPRSGQQHQIRDQRSITRLLGLLARPDAPFAAGPATQAPLAPVRLKLYARQPGHSVDLVYIPARHELLMYNTPSPAWNEHVVGTYAVPPHFGAALVEALGLP